MGSRLPSHPVMHLGRRFGPRAWALAGLAVGDLVVALLAQSLAPGTAATAWVDLAAAVAVVVLVVVGVDLAAGASALLARHHEAQRAAEDERRRLVERQRAADRSRAHQLGNAMLVIEGTVATLDRLHDRLSPNDRHQLLESVSGATATLRTLFAPPADEQRSEPGTTIVVPSASRPALAHEVR